MRLNRSIAFAALATVSWCLVGASSCSNSGGSPAGSDNSSTHTAAVPVGIGQAMTNKDGQSITVMGFTPNFTTQNEFETAGAGKECVQVALSLANHGNSEWTLPLSELAVVDASGQKYETAFNCGTADDISGLVAGGHATAKLVFEVPAGSALNLSWVPNQFESEVYETKLR